MAERAAGDGRRYQYDQASLSIFRVDRLSGTRAIATEYRPCLGFILDDQERREPAPPMIFEVGLSGKVVDVAESALLNTLMKALACGHMVFCRDLPTETAFRDLLQQYKINFQQDGQEFDGAALAAQLQPWDAVEPGTLPREWFPEVFHGLVDLKATPLRPSAELRSGGEELDRPGPLLRTHEQTARTLVPVVVQTVFQLCGPAKSAETLSLLQADKRVGLRFPAESKSENYVSLAPAQAVPTELRNARETQRLEAWIREQTEADISLLDELCWDVFMSCLVTFFKRTEGRDIRERFTFLFSDVFDYKDIKPTHQSLELKTAIFERMRYLSSQRLILTSAVPIHVSDPATGRKKRQAGAVHGPAFGWLGDVYSVPDGKLTTGEGKALQGVRVTLGEWARELVSSEAYLGQVLLRLARYHSGRQLWERRLGFYLLFQLYNQATSATWREVEGTMRMVQPQQPLYLETILNGTRMEWQKEGKEHPAALIRQIAAALETLRADGLPWAHCIDGAADGSDLDTRGRLPKLLKRRFNPLPGPLLEPHLAAKAQVKTTAIQKAIQVREQRQRKGSQEGQAQQEGRQ